MSNSGAPSSQSPEGAGRARPAPPEVVPPPVTLRILTIVDIGIVLWVLALVVLLLVPGLGEADRGWWVWVPVSGIVLGLIGHIYLARGRGNAADA